MAIIPSGIWPIDPTVTNGTELAQYLNDWVQAFGSQHANASRPPMIQRGGVWAKTIGAADIALMLYDGTTDHEIGKIVGGKASFGGGTNAGATAPTSPAAGDMWFDTAAKVLNIYDGANWGTVSPPLTPLTLDAVNNRVGINQATPAGQLHVGAGSLVVDDAGNVGIGTDSPSSLTHISRAEATGYNGSATDGQISAGATLFVEQVGNANNLVSQIAFQTRSGSPFNRIVNGGGTTPFMAFTTNNAERARIDDNGNLLVATTSTTINSSNFGTKLSPTLAHSKNSTAAVAQFYGSTGENRFLGTGAIQNTLNSYGAISDIKLKENIVDATPKLERLNQVRIVNFNLIGSEQKQIGVVAQELEQIFPSMVDNNQDEDSEGNPTGETTKSVKYSVFVPMLIKAIQELKAELDTVKAELKRHVR